MHVFLGSIVIAALFSSSFAKEVLKLQNVNFELAVSSYKYIAILFYDDSKESTKLTNSWLEAAKSVNGLDVDSEIAMIDGSDPNLKEITDAYSIVTPSIKVFRRGIMAEYRGPLFDVKGMAAYLVEDAQPSVRIVSSLSEMKRSLKTQQKTIVLGFFGKDSMTDEDIVAEGYSVEPWGQFQAAADSLRGHAVFFAVSSEEILQGFQVSASELPVVYLIPEDGEGLLQYTGEILELNLSEWVLRNAAPSMAELSLSTSAGELYATQFFSSKKLKFILFLGSTSSPRVVDIWRRVSQSFRSKALFSYMADAAVADVVTFFEVDVKTDLPLIVAHSPSADNKFKSNRLDFSDPTELEHILSDFVSGVLKGTIPRIIKSEPVPKKKTGSVIQAVGTNVVQLVSDETRDVLLEVYAPWCAHCKKLRSTYEILGKAVEAEERITIAKIDGTANDLPSTWTIKAYPALLWFPAKDKPYLTRTDQNLGLIGMQDTACKSW